MSNEFNLQRIVTVEIDGSHAMILHWDVYTHVLIFIVWSSYPRVQIG